MPFDDSQHAGSLKIDERCVWECFSLFPDTGRNTLVKFSSFGHGVENLSGSLKFFEVLK